MSYDTTFANPMGRTGRGPFLAGLIVLGLATAFYLLLVHAGRNGQWVMVTFLYPGFVLLARRLHDMGKSAWLLVVPGAVFAVGLYLTLFTANAQLGDTVIWVALGVSAALAAWGLSRNGQAEANKYGDPVG
jgi:uncharacterized membrane protein YhaH (DUF805 family)